MKYSFPILNKKINNHKMIYFDNAATTQKPQIVIDAISNYYTNINSNIHRSMNPLAEAATEDYEKARTKIAKFINAKKSLEIIFTKGTTESINLVTKSYGENFLKKGDRIVLSIAEHNSNIIPWLQLKEKLGIIIDYIPLTSDFTLNIEHAKKLMKKPMVKILAIQHASNVLGTVHPIKELLHVAKKNNIITLVDAAQSAAYFKIDVQKLQCDFLAFSAHKMFGPTGIGALYGKEELLNKMPAWQGGGDMNQEVFTDGFTTNDLPHKFEAGTPNIAGAIGFGVAINFIKIKLKQIQDRETELTKYFLKEIAKLDFVKLHGPKKSNNRLPVFSFEIKGVHPHDAGYILGGSGIITRAGQHCTQPLHSCIKANSTLRASLAFYNTKTEVDIFIKELERIRDKFI